jgi:hypothetical protein
VADPTAGLQNGDPDPDWDHDGLPNDWERDNDLDPRDATGDNGATGDPDRDGLTNLQEYVADTGPRDPSSTLEVTGVDVGAAETLIRFAAVAGRTYTVQFCDDLGVGDWKRLADVGARPSTGEAQVRDPARLETRFYRIVTPQMP